MSLLQTNATVSVSRNDGTPVDNMQHIGVYIEEPGPMNMDFQGLQTSTDMLGDDTAGVVWKANDIMTVESDGYFQVTGYTVTPIKPPRGLLGAWKLRVNGAVR